MSRKKTARQEESLLGLPRELASGFGSGLVPFNPQSQAMTRDERQVEEEFRKQIEVIQYTGVKEQFAQTQLGNLQQHAAGVFADTTDFIIDVKNQVRNRESEPYVEEFTKGLMQMAARHTFAVLEVGSRNIGAEVNRTLYVTAPPPGFWKRLTGKR